MNTNRDQSTAHTEAIDAITRHFHDLIREVIRGDPDMSVWLVGHLPSAAQLVASASGDPGYLRVPGMYGGFMFRLSQTKEGPKLEVDSWSRVIHGSEQTHVVTKAGWAPIARSRNENSGLIVRSPKEAGVPLMSVLCWNVNNRVGRTRFRPKAADAAMETGADVLVFNEFHPGKSMSSFRDALVQRGWTHQTLSLAPVGLKVNQVLVASRSPHQLVELPESTVDEHLTSNALCVDFPDFRLFTLRVPTYRGESRAKAWDWIASVAESIHRTGLPAVLCGDLNTSMATVGAARVPQFHALLESEHWRRVQPQGRGSFFGSSAAPSEIDHVLASKGCVIDDTGYLTDAGPYVLAGSDAAISDHAALLFSATSLDRVRQTLQTTGRER